MTARQARLPGIGRGRGGPVARVRRGVDAQIRAQRALGHLEPVDDGLVAIARTLADDLDAEHTDEDCSRYTVATLAGRLVPVLLELRGERAGDGGDYDAELAAIVAALRDAPRPSTARPAATSSPHNSARLRRGRPYPWQWDLVDVAGELADDGAGFRYRVVVVSVPRRAGKTVATLATFLDRMELLARRALLVHRATPRRRRETVSR